MRAFRAFRGLGFRVSGLGLVGLRLEDLMILVFRALGLSVLNSLGFEVYGVLGC